MSKMAENQKEKKSFVSTKFPAKMKLWVIEIQNSTLCEIDK